MSKTPCCSKVGLQRGPWTATEDALLVNYIRTHGEGHWRNVPKNAGLLRCDKSCRLRWMNYLRPNIKRGNVTPDEDDLIIRLHSLLGNRWSLIAGRLPGRTDNEIKNYWNTHLSKRFDKNTGTLAELAYMKKKRSRRNGTRTNKTYNKEGKQEKEENQGGFGQTTKINVHLPKAIRASSSLVTLNSMVTEPYSNEGTLDANKVNNFSWCDWGSKVANSANFRGCDDDPCQNSPPTNDNLLDDIFQEYHRLLRPDVHVNLDSFVASLLV